MSTALTTPLVTCPDCGQPNFTASGLAAHQGKAACKRRAAQLQIAAATDAPTALSADQTKSLTAEMDSGAVRMKFLQLALRHGAGQMKLLKFLSGLECNLLQDLHRELHGETRGGGAAPDAPTLTTWIADKIGVTERTWRRYLNFFRSITSQHPALAKKLIAHWEKWKSAKLKPAPKPKALKAGAKPRKAQLAKAPDSQLLAGLTLTEDDLNDLVTSWDEWGLHELFEAPIKDVTPKTVTPPPNMDARLKFWLEDFCKRALKDDYLTLPKDKREALLTTTQEMASKLADSLSKK